VAIAFVFASSAINFKVPIDLRPVIQQDVVRNDTPQTVADEHHAVVYHLAVTRSRVMQSLQKADPCFTNLLSLDRVVRGRPEITGGVTDPADKNRAYDRNYPWKSQPADDLQQLACPGCRSLIGMGNAYAAPDDQADANSNNRKSRQKREKSSP
jgi:hypothetical protein